MLLAIDVGNTQTHIGAFNGTELVEHWRFSTDRELAEVKDRVVRALTDFEYDALTFNFEDEAGGFVRINTHGKGRAGERPQELDLTLNVRGANDLLNHYLQATTKWDELSN